LRTDPRPQKGPAGEGKRRGLDLPTTHIEDVLALGLGMDPVSEETTAEAVRATYRRGLTLCDAGYLSLGERMDCPLVTEDDELRAASGGRGIRLEEWRETLLP